MYVKSVGVPTVSTVSAGTKTAGIRTANAIPVETVKTAAVESTVKDIMDGERQLGSKNNNDAAKKVTAANDTKGEERTAADNEKIKKTVEGLSAPLLNSEVKFGIHEKTNRVTIKIIDKESKKVIKEIPPEKTLNMIAKCMEIAGVLFDEKL